MSIIYRYISKQLLMNTLVVSSILVIVLVGGRFLRYLEHAAEGRLLGEVIILIMTYRLPEFLQMILPLGLFIGILLTFGRLYISNEMTVLFASGVSRAKLLSLLIIPTVCMSLFVAALSIFLGPLGLKKSGDIMFEQRNQSEFETLTPGRFHVSKDEKTVTYTARLSSDRRRMEDIFIAEIQGDQLITVAAQSGIRKLDVLTGLQYLELNTGHRYEVTPGSAKSRITQYDAYRLKLVDPEIPAEITEVKATPIWDLTKSKDVISIAELQWRFSLPILVPIIVILAVPLSRVNPRQGRYLKILPAILLYLTYLILLMSCKSKIERGALDPTIGMWWVHLLFIIIAVALHTYPTLLWKWRMARAAPSNSKLGGKGKK